MRPKTRTQLRRCCRLVLVAALLFAQGVPHQAFGQVPTVEEAAAVADTLRSAGITVNTAAPCCKPSIWDHLGCQQIHSFLGSVYNALCQIPLLSGLNAALLTPALQAAGLLPPADPAFAGADAAAAAAAAAGGPPPPPSAGAAAAKIAADQAAAAETIAAIRFLAAQDCNCYPEIVEALLVELDSCVEEVRYEALKALYGSCKKAACPHQGEPRSFVSRLFKHGEDNSFCGSEHCPTCACQRQIIVRVSNLLIDRNPTGTYREQSQRIRRLALALLKKCMLRVPPRRPDGRGLEPEPDPYLGPAPDPGPLGAEPPPMPQTNIRRPGGEVIRGQSPEAATPLAGSPRAFNTTADLRQAQQTGGLPTVLHRAAPPWAAAPAVPPIVLQARKFAAGGASTADVSQPAASSPTVSQPDTPASSSPGRAAVGAFATSSPQPTSEFSRSDRSARPTFFAALRPAPGEREELPRWTDDVPWLTRSALNLPPAPQMVHQGEHARTVEKRETSRPVSRPLSADAEPHQRTVHRPETADGRIAPAPAESVQPAARLTASGYSRDSEVAQFLADDLFGWNGGRRRTDAPSRNDSAGADEWTSLPTDRPAVSSLPATRPATEPELVPVPQPTLQPVRTQTPPPDSVSEPQQSASVIQQTSYIEPEFEAEPLPLPKESQTPSTPAGPAAPQSLADVFLEESHTPVPPDRAGDLGMTAAFDPFAGDDHSADAAAEESTEFPPSALPPWAGEKLAAPAPQPTAGERPTVRSPSANSEALRAGAAVLAGEESERRLTADAPLRPVADESPRKTEMPALPSPGEHSETPVEIPPADAVDHSAPAVVVRQAVVDTQDRSTTREPIELLSSTLQDPPFPGENAPPGGVAGYPDDPFFGPDADPIPGVVTVEEDEFERAMKALETEVLLPRKGYVNVGTERSEFALFEIDSARPINNFKLRFDSFNDWSRPDRSEYLWAEITGKGPEFVQDDINFYELRAYNEAGSDRVTAFFEVPYRVVQLFNDENTSGLGDLMIGAKTLLKESDRYKVTTIFKTFVNTGSPRRGLGTGHIALEPGVLANYRLSCNTWAHSEFKINFPIAGTTEFAGTVFKYGVGVSTVAYAKPLHSGKCDKFALLTTLELNGWNFHDGLETDPILGPVSASGTSVLNAMAGVRFVFEDKFELGLGVSRPLTDDRLWDNLFRSELRWLY